jgi:hypothetical protein
MLPFSLPESKVVALLWMAQNGNEKIEGQEIHA